MGKSQGMRQCETGSLAYALAEQDINAPHTGKPYTEAMLFGLGSGIGVGYYVFEYPGMTTLYLNTRFMTQETKEPGFHANICRRIGVKPVYINTPKPDAARKQLDKAVADGKTPVVWANRAALPYYALGDLDMSYHTFVVTGRAGAYRVRDRSAKPLSLTEDELIAAAMNPMSPKFRAMTIERSKPGAGADLESAIWEAIRACADQMLDGWEVGRSQSNTGIRGLEKWAAMMTDAKDKRSWSKLFSEPAALFGRLVSMYRQIEVRGERGALRNLYADFLDEAASVTGENRLNSAAESCRTSAKMWSAAAAALLAPNIDSLRAAREAIDGQDSAFVEHGAEALKEICALENRLVALKAEAGSFLQKRAAHQILDHASAKVRAVANHERLLFEELKTMLPQRSGT